jgi:MarR family transcriptional regulator, organic hydroperoxide resistance regulator
VRVGTTSTGRSYPQLELGRQLCFALYSAARAVVRTYGGLLAGLGLTYPQYLVMLALWEQPDRPHSVGELGARLQLDSGTLTPLLKRLEAAGRVERRRDPADERRVLVALTVQGRALREGAADVPRALARRTGMRAAQLAALRDELTRLVSALDDAERSAGASAEGSAQGSPGGER